jgi:hypothetical protein
MKKFIYISGIVVINIFVFGALFKVQHWPGAGILITSGLGLFCFCFLPLSFIQSYEGNGRKYKSLFIAGFICAFITFIGAMFKIQHWPGAGWFLLVGIPLPFAYFLPVFLHHHNKSKEKSNMNFLGVMFLMVYIALFTSILALNVSRQILENFNTGERDIAKTNDALFIKNKMMYESIEKSGIAENKEKVAQIKTKSEAIYTQINNIKLELVKSAENTDSKAIESGNKINTKEIMAKDESAGTTQILRSNEGASGKAIVLKNQINDYRDYLKSLVNSKSKSLNIIDELLSTADSPDSVGYWTGGLKKWEDQFFPNGAFLINALISLDCIETNIKLAESEALEFLTATSDIQIAVVEKK